MTETKLDPKRIQEYYEAMGINTPLNELQCAYLNLLEQSAGLIKKIEQLEKKIKLLENEHTITYMRGLEDGKDSVSK